MPAAKSAKESDKPSAAKKAPSKKPAPTPSRSTSAARIRIGIGGWTYAPWRGPFYPEDLAQSRELEYASRHLTSIEINGTNPD